jgi:hypothetical protein
VLDIPNRARKGRRRAGITIQPWARNPLGDVLRKIRVDGKGRNDLHHPTLPRQPKPKTLPLICPVVHCFILHYLGLPEADTRVSEQNPVAQYNAPLVKEKPT